MDYTVIGDAVNVAARSEALTRKLEVPLVITQVTYNYVSDLFDTQTDVSTRPIQGTPTQRTGKERIGRIALIPFKGVQVKGKKEGIDVFGIVSIPRE